MSRCNHTYIVRCEYPLDHPEPHGGTIPDSGWLEPSEELREARADAAHFKDEIVRLKEENARYRLALQSICNIKWSGNDVAGHLQRIAYTALVPAKKDGE